MQFLEEYLQENLARFLRLVIQALVKVVPR